MHTETYGPSQATDDPGVVHTSSPSRYSRIREVFEPTRYAAAGYWRCFEPGFGIVHVGLPFRRALCQEGEKHQQSQRSSKNVKTYNGTARCSHHSDRFRSNSNARGFERMRSLSSSSASIDLPQGESFRHDITHRYVMNIELRFLRLSPECLRGFAAYCAFRYTPDRTN